MMHSENLSKVLKDIILSYETVKVYSEPDFYGAGRIIKDKLNLPKNKVSYSSWSHGWENANLKSLDQIIWDKSWKYKRLVRTKEVENFLTINGVKNVIAVGLPIIYVDSQNISRRPNSVLIMPAHSLSYVNIEPGMMELINQALVIRESGTYICFCIHPDCIKHGKTIPLLNKYNLDWFAGASPTDINSLQRMRNIFEYFEVVGSNTIGSHFIYSQLFGAKFFFTDLYFEYKSEWFSKDPVLGTKEGLLVYITQQSSYAVIKAKYPKYFQGYKNAHLDKLFAEREVGLDSKVTFDQLSSLLGFDMMDQILFSLPFYTSKALSKFLR